MEQNVSFLHMTDIYFLKTVSIWKEFLQQIVSFKKCLRWLIFSLGKFLRCVLVFWCFKFPGLKNLWFWPFNYAFVLFGIVPILQVCIHRYVNRVVIRQMGRNSSVCHLKSQSPRSLFILYYTVLPEKQKQALDCDEDEQFIQECLLETKFWHFQCSYLPF